MTKIRYMMDGRTPIMLDTEDIEYAVMLYQTGLDGVRGTRTRMQVISQLRADGAGSREYCVCIAAEAESKIKESKSC